MVFITQSNSNKIISKVNIKDLNLVGEVYDKPIYFFNRYEEQRLLAIREFIEYPERFLDVYCKIEKEEDSYSYVYEGNKPAYHCSVDCPNISSDFVNYKIPEEIKKKGSDTIKKYRAWFKENSYLLEESNTKSFYSKCKEIFEIELSLDEIKYSNSGSFRIENIDLEELENEINDLIKGAGRFFYKSKKHTKILRSFSKFSFLAYKSDVIQNNNTGYTDAEVKEMLRDYDSTYKDSIKELLVKWYRVKYNPELSFDGLLLEQLGFHACKKCHGKNFDDDLCNTTIIDNTIRPTYKAIEDSDCLLEDFIIVETDKYGLQAAVDDNNLRYYFDRFDSSVPDFDQCDELVLRMYEVLQDVPSKGLVVGDKKYFIVDVK